MAISVVLYCYKNKLYFDQSIITLLNQDDCEWEAIVVNDGCFLDAEKSIPPQFEERFNFVKFKKPVGFLSCFLSGLSLSRNDHCILLRGWDFNSSNRLKKQHSLIEKINVDSIFSIPDLLSSTGKIKVGWDSSKQHPITTPSRVIEMVSKFPYNSTLGISSIMFDKNRLDLSSLYRYNFILREKTLQPSLSFLEKMLVETLLGHYVYIHNEPVVTVNCKPDVELFENIDRKTLVEYNQS